MNKSAWGKAAGQKERQRIQYERRISKIQQKNIKAAYEALQEALKSAGFTEEQ